MLELELGFELVHTGRPVVTEHLCVGGGCRGVQYNFQVLYFHFTCLLTFLASRGPRLTFTCLLFSSSSA